jgi:hypothetical protein
MRIDYVKFILRYPMGTRGQPEVRQHLDGIDADMRGVCEGLGIAHAKAYRSTTDYSQKETNGYIFEMWGKAADMYMQLFSHQHHAEELQRIDFRIELHQDFDPYTLEARAREHGRRNFQLFNTRAKSKLGDRDTGGYGIAKGSHKSRRRVVVYKRGSELPAIELQLRQQSAKDVFKAANSSFEQQYDTGIVMQSDKSSIVHSFLLDLLYAELNEDTEQELDMNLNWLINMKDSDIMDGQEQMLADMDKMWEKLNPTAKKAFLSAQLQLDL